MSIADDFLAVIHYDDSFTNFRAHLFRLIHKADWENLARLAQGFPNEVELFHWWRGSPEPPTDEQIVGFCQRYEPTGSTTQASGAVEAGAGATPIEPDVRFLPF